MVARLSRIAVTASRRSPRTRVTSPASMAMSVPVPIAMPRSAWASAGSVVDAVPDNGHSVSLSLQVAHNGRLVARPHFGANVVHADPASHGQGRRFAVAADHQHAETQLLQLGDSLGGFRPRGVGKSQQAHQPAINRRVDGRMTSSRHIRTVVCRRIDCHARLS